MSTFAMPILSRRAPEDPIGRARQPITAITCDPSTGPDVTLISLWRGRDYRINEHFSFTASALADLLKTHWDKQRTATLHVNPAGAGRAVLDLLRRNAVPVRPWATRPSNSVQHHGSDALRYALHAYQALDVRDRADTALCDSLDAIASAIMHPVKPSPAPATPAPRALNDSPWFVVGCAILGMLAGTVVVTTEYFFRHH